MAEIKIGKSAASLSRISLLAGKLQYFSSGYELYPCIVFFYFRILRINSYRK
jgi:hypothetical protein